MTERSADDMLEDGIDSDEQDLAEISDLLSEEMPASTTASTTTTTDTEDDEFSALLQGDDPAETVTAAEPEDMLADLASTPDETDDEFSGLDVPATAPPSVTEEEAMLEGLEESTEFSSPPDPIEELSATEAETEEEDPYEVTASSQNDVTGSPPPVLTRGQKAAETRRRRAAEQTAPTTEEASELQAETLTLNDKEEAVNTLATNKSPGLDLYPRTVSDRVVQVLSPQVIRNRDHEEPVEDAISHAMLEEAIGYGKVTPRDLYFYRLGLSRGMSGRNNAVIAVPPPAP